MKATTDSLELRRSLRYIYYWAWGASFVALALIAAVVYLYQWKSGQEIPQAIEQHEQAQRHRFTITINDGSGKRRTIDYTADSQDAQDAYNEAWDHGSKQAGPVGYVEKVEVQTD